MSNEAIISYKYSKLSPYMDEHLSRLWAATEAKSLGRGGIAKVNRATGISEKTIRVGMKEITKKGRKKKIKIIGARAIRKSGGGRKRIVIKDPIIKEKLEKLIDPLTRGDPMSPLLWTCKSTTKLAEELTKQGHKISADTVGNLLKEMGYSLQSNKKSKEGSNHPDRDSQFNYINEQSKLYQAENQPVISVDTKKKELIGEYKNNGAEWNPKGQPIKVNDHDFPSKESEKASPYGIYDIFNNVGWVNVGISADTAEFAVASIRHWWNNIGLKMYGDAKKILIMADGGGSNGYRNNLFKYSLQQLSNEINVEITMCHFPPGTSKWNKIEHRMFCHITNNWRCRPLTSLEVVVNTIKNTTTKKGLKINAQVDMNIYEKGKKIDREDLKNINIHKHDFHGEWNYTIKQNIQLNKGS